ncbi:MAG: alanine dehydrogenase, partial [Tannerellaceae bacterium]
MIIGVPKEIKNNENRVGLTPAGAHELTKRGHKVYVQATAGINSGFPDDEYIKAGAELLPTIEAVYAIAEMIVKVKEPIEPEYQLIRRNQLLFTYFHFASDEKLTRAMIERGAVCLAYETVEKTDRSLPLLVPMSEVAGRMSIQEGARFLEKPQGGKGILLGGVPGVKPAKVLILGGGIVGINAAFMAAGMGADVTIADISLPRLRYLDEIMPK